MNTCDLSVKEYLSLWKGSVLDATIVLERPVPKVSSLPIEEDLLKKHTEDERKAFEKVKSLKQEPWSEKSAEALREARKEARKAKAARKKVRQAKGELPPPNNAPKKPKKHKFTYQEGLIYLKGHPVEVDMSQYTVIEFDGGTPCNIPGKFGNGYGSYKVGNGEIVRLKFGPMSCNSAETWTAVYALESISVKDRESKNFLLRGDSQNALKWIDAASWDKDRKLSKGSSVEFRQACGLLFDVIPTFSEVLTEWRPRVHSVRIFGH